ncbi:aldose epimerase [Pectobacterium parmentieri]|uniref:aldose epimerase family protein n=1 Tax=Pectobacterium parmentieri TaxID=1905730 RepID=UPI0018E0D710|nr:aldose epimerase [Pectobacterium parmentieri]QQA74633.1 aldose epimerase [Pectobacterium parmentieri]
MMDTLTLSNSQLTLQVHPNGAEMRSLTDAQREWLWQPGDTGWQSTAPLLFPVVGQLIHQGVYHHGQLWPLPAHGFLRHQRFTVIEQRQEVLHLRCHDTPETLAMWPFRWQLDVHYVLHDRRVAVRYRLINMDDSTLWFSLGSHPGFALPISQEPGWQVRFSSARCRGPWRTQNRTLIVNEVDPAPIAGTLPLTSETFANGALYFSHAEQQTIDVISPAGVSLIRFCTDMHPWLALWSEPGADLLCIEPLFGTTDAPDFSGELRHKRGILSLASGESFECGFNFTVNADEKGRAR